MDPTDVLGLNRFELAEAFDYTLVNDNSDRTDRLPPTFCTSTTRPVTNLFNGRLIYETDTGGFRAYDLANTEWVPVGPPVIDWTPTTFGFTSNNLSGTYQIISKRIYWRASGTVTGALAGPLNISRPGNTFSRIYPVGIHIVGTVAARDVSANAYYTGVVLHRPTVTPIAITSMECMLSSSVSNTAVTGPGSNTPFTWANGDQFSAQGFYDLP